eukprot:16431151-Heterocapsa_arctica.AAC.1
MAVVQNPFPKVDHLSNACALLTHGACASLRVVINTLHLNNTCGRRHRMTFRVCIPSLRLRVPYAVPYACLTGCMFYTVTCGFVNFVGNWSPYALVTHGTYARLRGVINKIKKLITI